MISADMLACFVKVAETLSVGRSAQALNVAKSVVSKRIAQLEAHLAVTLFSRSTRRIVLTAAGELYLEHAKRALAELRAAEELLLASRSEIRGQIRISYRDWETDRKSTRLNSSHSRASRMPSSA